VGKAEAVKGSVQLRHFLWLREAGVERADAAAEVGFSADEARLTDIARDRGELDDIEPLDPAAPALGHNNPPEENIVSEGNVAADELRLLIERVERLEEEKKGIADDIKGVFGEAKARGYDPKTMRTIVRLRKMERNAREEAAALLQTYADALGMQGLLL
jgi:uncharacterized protein (UPF0335 family)